MSSVSLGRAVGKAYMLGEGLATVFASDKPNFFTVQADKSGRRYWMNRTAIKWRTVAPKEMEIAK
jgi:hypothetical protein